MQRLLSLCLLCCMLASCKFMSKQDEVEKRYENISDRKWWKEAVVYQVYPRSFKDSNGDGIGDLKGILSKLDYIKSLGIDVVWLNPIYGSPNDDNGYDISDYNSIMKEFGTMDDFNALLKGLHDRDIKLVMDLVVNHTSDEHEWFKQARSSRDNPYRNYYHWWPAEKGKPAHRYSFFDLNNEAWRLDSATNAYYLHYFSIKQPDLNWENPAVRNEIFKMMRFWFDKGVDGFRMDVIPFISKDTTFPELPAEYHGDYVQYYAKGPHMHEYLQDMNREVLSKYDVMTVGEGIGVQLQDALKLVDPDRKELNMFFHFDANGLGRMKDDYFQMDPNGYSLLDFKNVFTRWDSVFEQKGWGSIYLGNHDNPRVVSRWGNDAPAFREASAKLLNTFILSMRGTSYIYNGDELGMTNARFSDINDYRDIQTINAYKAVVARNGDVAHFLEGQKATSRDNVRTPFQWDTTLNAGFSAGTPWLKVNPNYTTINEAAQDKDEHSILNYFRKMVKVRKDNPVLIYGKYTLLDKENPAVYAFTRELNGKKALVLLNFSKTPSVFNLPADLKVDAKELLIGNLNVQNDQSNTTFDLAPYEARIYSID